MLIAALAVATVTTAAASATPADTATAPLLASYDLALPRAPAGRAPGLTDGVGSTSTDVTTDATTDATKGDGYGPKGQRDYLMQINARVRYLSVPDSIISPWFFNADDPGANSFDRPKVRGWAFGGEYVFDLEPGNYVIYAEYVKSTMGEGYWDDVEEPADHNDGDWIRPDGFGGVVLGTSYLHEVDAIPVGPDSGSVGLSFLFGAGLGVMVVNGGLEQWFPGSNPDIIDTSCRTNSPSYDRVDVCASDGYKRIPKVLPMVDLSASVRVNFANHFHVRIDGGVHDVLSVGTSMGAVF